MRTFCFVAIAVVLAAAMTVSGTSTTRLVVPSLVTVNTTKNNTCIASLDKIIGEVVKAGEEIAKAVKVCGNKTMWETCAADVSASAADLADAAKDVAESVTDCGHTNTACADQIIGIGQDVATTSKDIFSALTQCHDGKNLGGCIGDVINIAVEIDHIVKHVEKAIPDCKAK
jgi:hypothetical protein